MIRFKQFLLLGIFTAGLLFSSCQQEENSPSSVNGTITAYDVNTPSVITPLEGIKVYLMDGSGKNVPDILPEDAILDSAFTGASGNYQFNGLLPGSYAVMPQDTAQQHAFFDLANEATSPYFEVEKEGQSFTLDFSTPEPGAENSGDGFSIFIEYANVPEAVEYHVQVLRLESWLYLPADYITVKNVNRTGGFESNFEFDPPWQTLLGTQYNDLEIDFVLYENSWLGLSRFAYKTFSIDIPREGYPKEMHFKLDWAANSLKRTD